MQPELSNYSDLIEKQFKPKARKDLIEKLSEFNIIPNSMIDISDGLASDLIHLSVQSNLGVKKYEEKLPILKSTILTANELNLNPTTCALNGGEDYELLFSVNEKDYNMLKDNDIDITSIGYFTSNKKCNLVSKEGETISLKAQGWKHF